MKVLRVIRYEGQKLFKDRLRLIGIFLITLLVLGFFFFLCFTILGAETHQFAPQTESWSETLEASYQARADDLYAHYLVAKAGKSYCSGNVCVQENADELWRNYQEFCFAIAHKTPISQFNPGHSFEWRWTIMPPDSCYKDSPFLAGDRLELFQDLSFLVIPLYLIHPVYSAFSEEKVLGTAKNLKTMGVKNKDLLLGKMAFCGLYLLGTILFFFLIGFFFFAKGDLTYYDGYAYQSIPVYLHYFERWVEFAFLAFGFLGFFFFVASFPLKGIPYVVLSLIPCAAWLFAFQPILTISGNFPWMREVPFAAIFLSDSLRDGGFLNAFLLPFLIGLVFLGGGYLLQSYAPWGFHPWKKGKKA